MIENIPDLPIGVWPDPDGFARAAMHRHFNPETGSAYGLQRAGTLPGLIQACGWDAILVEAVT